MKTNGIPAIVMLAAGFIDCVIAIYTHMSLWNFTRQLLFVLILFYIIGCVVKMILDRNFKDMEEETKSEEKQDDSDGTADGEETEASEGEDQTDAGETKEEQPQDADAQAEPEERE